MSEAQALLTRGLIAHRRPLESHHYNSCTWRILTTGRGSLNIRINIKEQKEKFS